VGGKLKLMQGEMAAAAIAIQDAPPELVVGTDSLALIWILY
jgi:hypothetical protein